jgi:hypothetical protein
MAIGTHDMLATKLLPVFVLIASAASAAVTITSVTPSSGPSTGGTEVVVRGTGFSERVGSPSLPPGVSFGSTLATEVLLADESTIRVIAPPHLPGVVSLTVHSGDGTATLPDAFSYLGDGADDHFERILLPVLTPPVAGAFGSQFHTIFRADASRASIRRVEIYGLAEACLPPPRACVALDAMAPLVIPSVEVGPLRVVMSGKPGRFVFVPDAQLDRLSLHLRVHDTTRSSLDFGTEMPIVREDDFRTGRLVLLAVPTDPRFRNTLRLYSTRSSSLRITVDGQAPVDIGLPGGADIFDPAYASFTQFPVGLEEVNVTIEPTPNQLPVVTAPFWAFITVTNNESQAITTITPKP